MIFRDGAVAVTALSIALLPCEKGIALSFSIEILFYNLMMISGKKRASSHLEVDSAGRLSTTSNNYDVLLRKRA